MNRDEEHLRLLSIFYYVKGGLTALGACFFGIYILIGIVVLAIPKPLGSPGQHNDAIAGIMLMFIGVCAGLIVAAIAGLEIFVGRCLNQKKHYTFCVVMAGVSCIFFPLGTILGVFSLVVLLRPTVKPIFEGNIPPVFPR
jgi:hypothetical protein